MDSINYDIIIPVAARDVSFLWRVVRYIRLCLKNANIIYIITNANNFKKIKHISDSHVVMLDENRLYNGLTFKNIEKYLRKIDDKIVTGWYFQQFLKYAFALSPYSNKYYLSWDSDTLPLSYISFFDGVGHPKFTLKSEYNKNYFCTIDKLLGLKKCNKESFIAEHMMFDVEIVKELVDKIEKSSIEGNNWFEKIMNACNFKDVMPPFSEFETYGTFVETYHKGYYLYQKLNTFRCGGLIRGRNISDNMLRMISFDTDIISLEMRDEPLFPYNIPNKIFYLKQTFFKFRKYGLVKSLNIFLEKMYNTKKNKLNREKTINNLSRVGK